MRCVFSSVLVLLSPLLLLPFVLFVLVRLVLGEDIAEVKR